MFILATIGMSHTLVDGSIFNPFKVWLEKGGWFRTKLLNLMNCYQCSGWWSGLFTGSLMCVMGVDPLNCGLSWMPLSAFIYGCAGSYLSPQAAIFIVWIQTHTGNNQ